MKNLKYIFTLAVVALTGLSLTGCSEDDLDTNPYSQKGVNIVAFGPSPILRTNEIHITGTKLNEVTAVAFPGRAVVERASFNNSDAENIYVNVPDESIPGQIHLLVGNDTVATSVTLLTFEEPIEVTSITPVTGLSAGDEITVRGDYVYNIAEAIFTNGVTGAPVAAEDFTYISRREIRLRVPLQAETGVITFNDGANWEFEYPTTLEILPGTYNAVSATTADFGQQITITGTNLHTVESVLFGGAVSADFIVSDDHNSLTVTVPAECRSGAITLVLYSGASITADEFSVPTLTVESAEPNSDLRVGDVVTLTGENFDRIASVTLPGIGEFADYTVSGNTLTFTVPEGMTDGKMVLTQNSYISVEVKLGMHSDAPEQTIWAGEFNCGEWGGNQDLAWGGFDWTTVAAGTAVNFYYRKNTPGEWACISLRHGNNWAALPDPIPGQYDLDEDEGVLTVVFPQNVLDDIIAEGGLVITGAYYTLTKVTIPIAESVLWQGSEVINWNNGGALTDLSWGGYDWASVAAGTTLCITYEKETPGEWGCLSLRHGDSWGNLPGDFGSQYDFPEDSGTYEEKLTQDVIDDLAANSQGLIITGYNFIIKKVSLK